jgi:hypothetical protein
MPQRHRAASEPVKHGDIAAAVKHVPADAQNAGGNQ